MPARSKFAVSSAPDRVMAAQINAFDWASHPLGEIATWPHALHNIVSTMLASRFAMYLAWGSEGFSFYNDGYIPILTDKHPDALGAPLEVVWGELAPDIRKLIDLTYQDQSSYFEDLPIQLMRNGRLEDCYFTFSYSGVRGDTGKIEGFYAVCIETTQTFLAKQERASEIERLSALFNQAPGFITALRGPDHVFEMANDAYRSLVGSGRELIGKTVREALPEAAAQGFVSLLDNVYLNGEAYMGREVPVVLARHAGQPPTQVYIDFIYQPIFNAAKQVTGVMVQGYEVTDAYLARNALVAADQKKDQFIAVLSHELRNPLAPIRTAASLLTLPNVTPAVVRQSSSIIERQVAHMANLLDDLLDVTRISRGQAILHKERVSVATIIATAVESARPIVERKQHQLVIDQQEAVEVDGDPVRLIQIVANLISNAAKYMDCNGSITVSVVREDGQCRVLVQDQGVGIAKSELTAIFEMFSQQAGVTGYSEGGLGIGLSLVKGLVELHGGSVHAMSDGVGKGSTFIVTLPCLADSDVPLAALAAREPLAACDQLTILVVDDNLDFGRMLGEFLEALGHQVHVASNGPEALELAARARPHVAVLDIGMPGMSGHELAAAIRAHEWGRKMVLVAATGWGTEADRTRTMSSGFHAHLTKPFPLQKIEDILRELNPLQ